MSFCVSHRRALDKNLKHLYSGLPNPVVLRASNGVLDGSLDPMDRVVEKHKRPPERFESKFQEYLPQYSARLPRAPAFRQVSPEQAREISERLSRPTFMSAIRRQSAVSRGAAERAESRQCRSRATSGMLGSDKEESSRKRQGSSNGNPCRKISYQDWSDEESGAYYYEDEESSIVDSYNDTGESFKQEKTIDRNDRSEDRENHVIDFGAAPNGLRRERNRRNDKNNNFRDSLPPQNAKERLEENDKAPEFLQDSERQDIRSRCRPSSSESGSDANSRENKKTTDYVESQGPHSEEQSTEIDKETSHINASLLSSISNVSSTAPDRKLNPSKSQQNKANLSKQKVSLLEQIMQTRTPQHRGKYSTNSRLKGGSHVIHEPRSGNPKRLQKREPMDTRLKHSPYCEPMPQLFIVYTPVAHGNARGRGFYGNQRGRSQETWNPHRGRARHDVSSSSGVSNSAGPQRRLEQRPDTRQSARPNKYCPPARLTVSANNNSISVDQLRSRSAPPDRSKLLTKASKPQAINRKRFLADRVISQDKTGTETRHNQYPKGTEEAGQRENSKQASVEAVDNDVPQMISTDSKDGGDVRRTESTVHPSREINRGRGASSHPHLWFEYEEVRYRNGEGGVYASTEDGLHKRFASPEEMSRVNKRLQKPTKVQLIRERMRWGSNNDRDLADPVRVIQEVTGGHNEVDWKRNKGGDARGAVNEGTVDHAQSSSDDSGEDNEWAKDDREKQESMIYKEKLRQKSLKNKKDAWVKKGVIQARKNLIITKPQTHSKNRPKNQRIPQQRETKGARSRRKPAPVKVELKEINTNGGEGRSFPRARPTRSRSSSTTPRSRSSSKASSRSSKGSLKSSAKSRSLSRSRSRSHSSMSRSSRSRSRSRSISKSSSRSRSRSELSSESKNNSATLAQSKAEDLRAGSNFQDTEKGTENSVTGDERISSRNSDDDIASKEKDNEHDKTKEISESYTADTSFTPQSDDDKQDRGLVKEYHTRAAETPEGGRVSKAGYSVGEDSSEGRGRGDEYNDGCGRGLEDDTIESGFTAKFETNPDQSYYSHSRQTRGTTRESSRSEDGRSGSGGGDGGRSSFTDKPGADEYSVPGEMYATNPDSAASRPTVRFTDSNDTSLQAKNENGISQTPSKYIESSLIPEANADSPPEVFEEGRCEERENYENSQHNPTQDSVEKTSNYVP